MGLDTSRFPFGGELVSVVDEEVGRAGAVLTVSCPFEMDLDVAADGEAILGLRVTTNREAQSLVEAHGCLDVADGEGGRNPFPRQSVTHAPH